MTQIINESLVTGKFPTASKLATVCPVYKSGDRTIASNYRLVSLLPVTSKLLEKAVHKRFKEKGIDLPIPLRKVLDK